MYVVIKSKLWRQQLQVECMGEINHHWITAILVLDRDFLIIISAKRETVIVEIGESQSRLREFVVYFDQQTAAAQTAGW